MKTVGVIGGLGPMATVYFLELLTKMTEASCDQEHLKIYMASIPDTPDRTAYILKESKDNPLPYLVEAGKKLADMGADFIAIPCVTAQYFHEELVKQIGIPVISLCHELACELAGEGIKSVAVLATSGTMKSRVMQDELEAVGIQVMDVEPACQDTIMTIIYEQIKKGKKPDIDGFCRIGESLVSQGAGRIILGCTELSLIKKDYELEDYYTDVLEVLAKKVVTYADKCFRVPGRDGAEAAR